MEIKIKDLVTVAIIYMYLPMAIFLVGWLKPVIALFASIIMVVSLILGLYSYNKKATEEEEKIFISIWMLALSAFLVLFICLNTGIGGFTGQTGDWSKHNAVLHDLIEYRWPVVYTTSYGDSMLSYYIGQYLLPAVIGKIFHSFHAAELMMYAFSVFGLYLIWLIMVAVCKAEGSKKQIICLLLLFFFGGLIIVGQSIAGNLYPENFPYGSHEWMNPYTIIVQYSANWSLLKWVPGQVIVPWLATLIFLLKPEKVQAYVMMGLPVLLFSGFAMVGLVFMMLAYFLYHLAQSGEENIGKKAAKVFSLSNLMLAAIVGSICILYFTGNLMGEKPEYMELHLLNYGKKKIFYAIFCFFSFGYYMILLWKDNRKNSLYFITAVSLCIYPRLSMGVYNDFTMRTSIPALFTLLILILRFLFLKPAGKERDSFIIRRTLIVAGLAIGMIYPLLNLGETIVKSNLVEGGRRDEYGTLEQFADFTNPEIADDLKYNYYSYDLEHDIFYQYLAK